jgi:hypothetical protein
MPHFTVQEAPAGPDRSRRWCVDVDGSRYGHYSTQWAAIVATFVAAHDATLEGDEATIVMETSCNQTWTFSLLPGLPNQATNPVAMAAIGTASERRPVD